MAIELSQLLRILDEFDSNDERGKNNELWWNRVDVKHLVLLMLIKQRSRREGVSLVR